jgi:hypothetical protein
MGIADLIRIALGRLTPEEAAERDDAARRRRELAEQRAATAIVNARRRHLYPRRLVYSGGISSVELTCHEDTWEFITHWMSQHNFGQAWWKPEHNNRITRRQQHMVSVHLSGPQLAEILTRMAIMARVEGARVPWTFPEVPVTDRAVALRVYDAIGALVDQVDPNAAGASTAPCVGLTLPIPDFARISTSQSRHQRGQNSGVSSTADRSMPGVLAGGGSSRAGNRRRWAAGPRYSGSNPRYSIFSAARSLRPTRSGFV